ncbi:hypothetical protein OS493_039659 [Desmophyllum pertusum]|uniref:Uncharacterized protein n=1 Tax=Desmophyllum pertusum TaxID=174260 RepID=A0A9W9YHA1_9CNID|nr:hypothetical protein OS493_039659 [Desmophyllum pertusum]
MLATLDKGPLRIQKQNEKPADVKTLLSGYNKRNQSEHGRRGGKPWRRDAHRQGTSCAVWASVILTIRDLQGKLVELATVPVSAVQNWCDPFHQDHSVRKVLHRAPTFGTLDIQLLMNIMYFTNITDYEYHPLEQKLDKGLGNYDNK